MGNSDAERDSNWRVEIPIESGLDRIASLAQENP